MKIKSIISYASALLIGLASLNAQKLEQKPLVDLIKVPTGPANQDSTWKVPMIAWGGDLQEIEANGGLETAAGSIFASEGLKVKLFREDDFRKQVELYKKGDINFLRGTVGMLNSATELLNQDEATKFEVIHLLTRSVGGDALVTKSNIKNAKDLKGKTIAIQAYGPHVDYLTTILRTIGLSTNDVKVVWCPDLFQVNDQSFSPAMALEQADVDAAFAIIPDALAITNNGTVGTGAEGTIKGAKILLSTKTASNVIYDAYAVRKSFAVKHPNKINAFVRGMLKGQEKLAEKMKKNDKVTLQRGAKILLDDASATEDMAGMYADAAHASWAENKAFLTGTSGRTFKQVSDSVQGDFVTMGLLSRKVPIGSSLVNFDQIKGGIKNLAENTAARFNKDKVQQTIETKRKKGELSDDELYSFEIYFQPGQNVFSADQYEAEFNKAIELMSVYGGAILTVEGHSDPLGYLKNKYKAKATPVVLQRQKQAALNLSLSRANSVKKSLISYALQSNVTLDESQFGTIGHGVVHPTFKLAADGDIDKSNAPKSKDEWNKMRRVKFRLIQIEAETEVFEALDF